MKKIVALLIPLAIGAILVLGFRFFQASRIEVGALQVTATPQAEVFLDNVSLGKTPLYNDKLATGEHTLKLVPTDSVLFNFEEKVTLGSGILTVLDRIFKATEAESETSIISLEPASQKKAVEISIVTSPEGTQVKLDEEPQGISPLLLKDISVSDHQITLTKEGYNTKTLRVRPAEGYRLAISTKLSIERITDVAPTPSTATVAASVSARVQILETPTGFLRVRSEPTTAASESARVTPGDAFPLLDTKDGWYKITLPDGKEGWISSQYAKEE